MARNTDSHYSRFTPWFGEWPPRQFDIGDDEMAKQSIWEKKSVRLAIEIGVGGVLLIALSVIADTLQWATWIHSSADALGVAFIIASLLALVFDIATRKEVIDDVVEASLGYVLPPCLRPGMRWIYNQKIVCVKHDQTVEITPNANNKTVVVKIELHRSFENISNAPAKMNVGLSIDELFAEGGNSDILSMGYYKSKTKKELSGRKHKSQNGRMVIEPPEQIELEQRETIDVWSIFQEVRQLNDSQSLTFGCATQNPEVTVHVPDSLGYDVGFEYAGDEDMGLVCLADNRWRLPTTVLPKQSITVRWWEKEKVKIWASENR